MKVRKKPVVVEAITFDELVEYGREHCDSHQHNGMPWSFTYKGYPITHETDDCYIIPTLEGDHRFTRGDMLITGVKGEIYPCKPDIFAMTYEAAPAEKDDNTSCGRHWNIIREADGQMVRRIDLDCRQLDIYEAFCRKRPPVEYLRSDHADTLQAWVVENLRPQFAYATGISVIDAAEDISGSQVVNGYEEVE